MLLVDIHPSIHPSTRPSIHPSIHEAIFSGDAHGRIRVWDSASVQHGSRAVLCAGAPECPGRGWAGMIDMESYRYHGKTIGKP